MYIFILSISFPRMSNQITTQTSLILTDVARYEWSHSKNYEQLRLRMRPAAYLHLHLLPHPKAGKWLLVLVTTCWVSFLAWRLHCTGYEKCSLYIWDRWTATLSIVIQNPVIWITEIPTQIILQSWRSHRCLLYVRTRTTGIHSSGPMPDNDDSSCRSVFA